MLLLNNLLYCWDNPLNPANPLSRTASDQALSAPAFESPIVAALTSIVNGKKRKNGTSWVPSFPSSPFCGPRKGAQGKEQSPTRRGRGVPQLAEIVHWRKCIGIENLGLHDQPNPSRTFARQQADHRFSLWDVSACDTRSQCSFGGLVSRSFEVTGEDSLESFGDSSNWNNCTGRQRSSCCCPVGPPRCLGQELPNFNRADPALAWRVWL